MKICRIPRIPPGYPRISGGIRGGYPRNVWLLFSSPAITHKIWRELAFDQRDVFDLWNFAILSHCCCRVSCAENRRKQSTLAPDVAKRGPAGKTPPTQVAIDLADVLEL